MYLHWFIVDSGSHDVAVPFSILGGGGVNLRGKWLSLVGGVNIVVKREGMAM